MNWKNFGFIWGAGNIILGAIANNLHLSLFGCGIIFGVLIVCIERDKELLKKGQSR